MRAAEARDSVRAFRDKLHVSYYGVMAAVVLDTYPGSETTCLVAEHGHPGPWNAKWLPTPIQFETYVAAVRSCQDVSPTAPLSLNVGRNR
jgi:hypothetical protein